MAIKAPLITQIHVGPIKQLGTEGAADPMDQPWTTGIFKDAVEGPVWLSTKGLAGDSQHDDDHGGAEMATLSYSADHYPVWREELKQPFLKPGAFGENFIVSRLDERTVCIGDTYTIGDARVQVSMPRRPCWKLARRLRDNGIIERVHAKAWGGWYCRVLQEGFVERSNFVLLESRPCPEWTVARTYDVYHRRAAEKQAAAELSACTYLAPTWRERLRNS